MKVEVKDNQLIITVPIAPHPSASGKTTVIASTYGFMQSTATYNGKVISVGLNATIKK